MSEAPKKIWIYGKQWQEAPEFYPMTFESDKPMVSKESYIRADIVDELVDLLKQDLEWMEKGDEIGYGSDYYNKVKVALAKLEESHEQ